MYCDTKKKNANNDNGVTYVMSCCYDVSGMSDAFIKAMRCVQIYIRNFESQIVSTSMLSTIISKAL